MDNLISEVFQLELVVELWYLYIQFAIWIGRTSSKLIACTVLKLARVQRVPGTRPNS